MRTVGSYEAKTHLPRLLDEVAKGETITITKHGRPVAVLAPLPQVRDVKQTIEKFKAFSRRQGRTLGKHTVRDLIESGRRF